MMDMPLGEEEAFGEYLANHHALRKAKVVVLHEPGFNPNSVIDVISHKNGYQRVEISSLADAMRWRSIRERVGEPLRVIIRELGVLLFLITLKNG